MSLEGLLAVAGIILAIYAIPQPVQRRSINLFVPAWLMPAALSLAAIVLFVSEWVTTFECPVPRWFGFTVTAVSFGLPVVATLLALFWWWRARLNGRSASRFRPFLLACLRDASFDELVRIVEKNPGRLAKALAPDDLHLLFEPRFVRSLAQAHSWLHLQLLSDKALAQRLPAANRAVDTVVRAYLNEPGSVLHASVACSYGAEEHSYLTDADWKLAENTLLKPEWYMNLRVDYPLLMAACENLDSGRLDEAYNRNDSVYIANQGISSRTSCPVFVAMKTHVLMLEEAAKQQPSTEMDLYVSDLWDIFRAICEHSRYDPAVWDSPTANHEYPTPFAYLIAQMLSDYSMLSRHSFDHGKNPPGHLAEQLATFWSLSAAHLAADESAASDGMRRSAVYRYLDFTLELRDHDTSDGRGDNCRVWADLFLDRIKKNMMTEPAVRAMVEEAANRLDICKEHVFRQHEWLRTELGLGARPIPPR